MARILFAWELGAGLGHLSHLAPLALELRARGHDIVAAVADQSLAKSLLCDIRLFDAPCPNSKCPRQIVQPGNFAEVLHAVGWSSTEQLSSLIESWRQLFRAVRPHLVVLDYSPTALLALHGYRTNCVQVGSGYYCPIDVTPLPDLCPWMNNYPDRLIMAENAVLAAANQCLAQLDQPPLPRLAAMFHRPEKIFLATFRELDHYPDRRDGDYWGVWSEVRGAQPEWPGGDGPRIFAYLRPSGRLSETLAALAESSGRTLVYLADADPQHARPYASERIRFSTVPFAMDCIVPQCDLAVVYASHATVAECLLAGKPILAIPNHNEQLINARNIELLEAGVCVSPLNSLSVHDGLELVLNDSRYAAAAQNFARKYAGFEPRRQVALLVDQLEHLVYEQ